MREAGTGYHWGQGARLRAKRNWLGISVEEMLGKMTTEVGRSPGFRSYQRMESGTDAIHESLWDSVKQVEAAMERDVEALIESVPADTSEHIVQLPAGTSGWWKQVIARAVHADPRIVPKTEEDILAEQEMTG